MFPSPERIEATSRRASASRRLRRLPRHTCRCCEQHPAKFRYRGEVRADQDHELCFQCFRAEVNRQRATRLVAA